MTVTMPYDLLKSYEKQLETSVNELAKLRKELHEAQVNSGIQGPLMYETICALAKLAQYGVGNLHYEAHRWSDDAKADLIAAGKALFNAPFATPELSDLGQEFIAFARGIRPRVDVPNARVGFTVNGNNPMVTDEEDDILPVA